MKVHVQRKRQEKQQLIEARRKREAERKAQGEEQGRKMDLKQFVTQVPEHQELHSFDKEAYSSKEQVYYVSEIINGFRD